MKAVVRGIVAAVVLAVPVLPASADQVDKVLDRFAGEPTVREVQLAAMEYAEVNPKVLKAHSRNAKAAKLLPRTRVRVDRSFDDDRSIDINLDGERTVGIDTDDDTDYQFQADWNFDELLMSSERIRVIRENSRLVELRDDLLDEVTKLYFDRRRLQVRVLLRPSSDLNKRVEDELRLQELTAQIDALTGGFLTAKTREARSE